MSDWISPSSSSSSNGLELRRGFRIQYSSSVRSVSRGLAFCWLRLISQSFLISNSFTGSWVIILAVILSGSLFPTSQRGSSFLINSGGFIWRIRWEGFFSGSPTKWINQSISQSVNQTINQSIKQLYEHLLNLTKIESASSCGTESASSCGTWPEECESSGTALGCLDRFFHASPEKLINQSLIFNEQCTIHHF